MKPMNTEGDETKDALEKLLAKKLEELEQNEGQLIVVPDIHVLSIDIEHIRNTLLDLKKEEQMVTVRLNEMLQKYEELARTRMGYEQSLKQMELSLRQLKPKERQEVMGKMNNEKRVIVSMLEKSGADFRRYRDEVAKLQARLADIGDQKKRLTFDRRQKDQDMTTARRLQFMREKVSKLKLEIADIRKKLK